MFFTIKVICWRRENAAFCQWERRICRPARCLFKISQEKHPNPRPQFAPTLSSGAATPLAAAADNFPHLQDKEGGFFCQLKHQAHTLYMESLQFGVKLTSRWAEHELEGDVTGSRYSDYKLNFEPHISDYLNRKINWCSRQLGVTL